MFASILRERLYEMLYPSWKVAGPLSMYKDQLKKQGALSESIGSSPNLECMKKGSVSLRWMTALMPWEIKYYAKLILSTHYAPLSTHHYENCNQLIVLRLHRHIRNRETAISLSGPTWVSALWVGPELSQSIITYFSGRLTTQWGEWLVGNLERFLWPRRIKQALSVFAKRITLH